ncbi:hypothetical protein ACWCOV_10035 [Kribbella sp. NPDC002412]
MSDDAVGSSEPFAGLVPETLAEAGIGFATGGPIGAAVGAVKPFVTRLIKLSAAELRSGDERVATTWRAAADSSHLDLVDLVDRAMSDPDRQFLGYSASEAARYARTTSKLNVLGQALATGVLAEDEAVLDNEQQVVDALSQIERPHLAVMWALRTDSGAPNGWAPLSLNWEELQAQVPAYRHILPRLLGILDREGLVSRQSTVTIVPTGEGDAPRRPGREDYSGDYWALTQFGLELLSRLYRAGLETPEADATSP